MKEHSDKIVPMRGIMWKGGPKTFINRGTNERWKDILLCQDEEKDLLRFITAGSVDDSKSTLIGRLLFDLKGVYEDQLMAVRKAIVNESSLELNPTEHLWEELREKWLGNQLFTGQEAVDHQVEKGRTPWSVY